MSRNKQVSTYQSLLQQLARITHVACIAASRHITWACLGVALNNLHWLTDACSTICFSYLLGSHISLQSNSTCPAAFTFFPFIPLTLGSYWDTIYFYTQSCKRNGHIVSASSALICNCYIICLPFLRCVKPGKYRGL